MIEFIVLKKELLVFFLQGTFSLVGGIFGVASSIFVAFNSIYTTISLPCVDKNIWRLCLYNNFNACILFLPLMLIFGEYSIVINYQKLFHIPFWITMTISGIFAFAMNYVTFCQIQSANSLTHKFSTTIKSLMQTLLAVMIYSEVKFVFSSSFRFDLFF